MYNILSWPLQTKLFQVTVMNPCAKTNKIRKEFKGGAILGKVVQFRAEFLARVSKSF